MLKPFTVTLMSLAMAFTSGTFAADAKSSFDFRLLGENLLSVGSSATGLKATRGTVDRDGERLALHAQGRGTFTLRCPLEKNAEYLFRVKVRSEAQFVARIGGLSMAYNDLGQWQTVTGLYRNNDAAAAEITFTLAPLEGNRESRAEIEELSLVRVERPSSVARRELSGATPLVRNGKAAAMIVIPAQPGIYRELGEKIAAAIRGKTGVALQVVTDAEATEREYPVLKPPFRSSPLIVLGRLGNNRALWAAYNQFRTAVDGYYPGGDGYTLHTATNLFHSGVNHLIIGGTSDEGVRRGTEKFLEKIAATAPGEDLQLPWLLEVDLQGPCLDFFKAENARWEEVPENPLLPKPEPGYGNVVRWYQNAMGYYWTGWDSFRERADRALEQVLREKAITHHYIVEFLVRTFEMLHGSDAMTPKQVAAMDALVTANFLDFMTVSDLTWMTTFAPPYGQIGLVNRHQIAPWIADWKMAELITGVLTPQGAMKELAEFRRQEKEQAFRNFVAHRSGPSLPGGVADEAYDEINATFFRFSLEQELYKEFFGSGNARKALALERINARTGQIVFPGGNRDTKLSLGILTSLTGDPELNWLWRHLPESVHVRGYFQGRYLGQVRRYTPDAALPEAQPKQGLGLQVSPNPVDNSPVQANPRDYYFLSYRSGFAPDDDYIAFNGVSYTAPSGTIPALISNGVAWLGKGDEGGGRFNLNSATAIRTDSAEGHGQQGGRRQEDLSRCLWSAETPAGTAMRLRQSLAREIQWTRDVVIAGRGLFIFRDEFKAFKPGDYALSINWQPIGKGALEGETATFIARDGKMTMTLLGDGFTPRLNGEDGAVHTQTLRHLEAGESAIAYTVLQTARSHQEPPIVVRKNAPEELTLSSPKGEIRLGWKPGAWADAAITCDADLVIQTASDAAFFQCRKLAAAGKDVAGLNTPSSFSLSSTGEWNLPDATTEEGRTLFTALRDSWAHTAAAPRESTRGSDPLQVEVTEGAWSCVWSYGQFLRPVRVNAFTSPEEGVVDFGKVLDLAEIRAKWVPPLWAPAELPGKIVLATGKVDGRYEWKEASGKREWRPGIRTANYGEVHPEPKTDETLLLEGVPARYVKTEPAAELIFFTNDRKESRHPLRLERGDFLGNGTLQTLVVSDIFPQFPRAVREDDCSVALLDATGEPLFQLDLKGPVQAVRLLDRTGNGKKELFVLYANGTVEIRALDGTVQASADLYALHTEFDRTFGTGNTRAPAGGYVLPFSIGTWRPDASGQRRLVIGRYGGFSFLKPDLSFEGLLAVSGYATPGLLAEGVDFGSGVEEQVAAERLRFWHLGGTDQPTRRDPGGHQYWPQVYDLLKTVKEDESSKVPLAGMPIRRYELLDRVTEHPRYILLARGTTLSIYDGKAKEIHYSWTPAAAIRDLAITTQSHGKLGLVIATADSLLWQLQWEQGLDAKPTATARVFPDSIHALREAPDGSLLIAGAQGLYHYQPSDGTCRRIAQGAFRAVAPGVSPGGVTAVAATETGEVLCFQPGPGRMNRP